MRRRAYELVVAVVADDEDAHVDVVAEDRDEAVQVHHVVLVGGELRARVLRRLLEELALEGLLRGHALQPLRRVVVLCDQPLALVVQHHDCLHVAHLGTQSRRGFPSQTIT